MTRVPGNPAVNPLHRIAGAVVLVVLAVVFVPLIVQPGAPPSPVAAVPAAPVAAVPAAARVQPLTVAPGPRAATIASRIATRAPLPRAVPARHPVAMPPRVRPPARALAHQASPIPPARRSAWYVQVASFTRRGDADRVAGRLRHAGFAAHVARDAHVRSHVFFRVRVGPYRNRRAADLAQGLLHRAWRGATWVRQAA